MKIRSCLRYLALHAGLALLVLLCNACSINPYQTPQPIERPVPAQTPDQVPTQAAPSQVGASSSPHVMPGSAPIAQDAQPILERVATTARRMVGVPYHYGGHSPRGFDCSGLVFYAYREAGIVVPRTSREQLRVSQPLDSEQALPGDLVFFSTSEKASHVGIYLGGQRFLHAPSTGKAVVIERLDQEYYRRHLIQIGRINTLY